MNARAYGKNFTISEIGGLADTARSRGRKLLVAVNSLMKEAEIPEAIRLLSALNEIRVDALIIQDMGIWRIARKYFPDLRLHASTLMTIHNSLGVQVAEKMGFSRVVLARELTLREIAAISRASRVDLEVFVHGAMCFTVSGLCLFSSYFGGRSSTRGRCVQPCRRRYNWKGVPGTFFSMDDLCGLEVVPELARMGISSLKIEGRLKPPGYVAAVTRAYRTVIDAGADCSREVLEKAKKILNEAMGRPLSSGYFFSDNPGYAVSPTRTANTGLYLGKVKSMKRGWLTVSGPVRPEPGDRLRLVIARRDWQFSTRCDKVAREKDSRWRLRLGSIPETLPGSLSGALIFNTGPADKEKIQPLKTPGSSKDAQGRQKDLQNASRKAQEIIRSISKPVSSRHTAKRGRGGPELFLKLGRLSDMKIIGRLDIKGIILDVSKKNIQSANGRMPREVSREDIIWGLPPVVFNRGLGPLRKKIDLLLRQGFRSFQVANLSHIALFKNSRRKRRLNIFSAHQMNILNSEAIKAAEELGISICHFSIETDLKNLKQAVTGHRNNVIFTTYGFIPLFTSRLRHRLYDSRSPVISTRREEYHWKRSGDTGQLYAKTPFSALACQEELLKAGVNRWILDLSCQPGKRSLPRRLPSNLKALSARFRGRNFNLLKNLE